ncbi:HIT family protein [Desulfovermiculus halophilus]|uniref:HIT family protein n=1 Tax=Desulfovermiculus halophilus TaxID=339722 RepID=UPI0004863B19|nr:HIT family protein [Desulfovermiculus halophilus]
MQECIFCRILRGEVPCEKVYATSNVLAFLDVAPISAGHTLVVPAHHYPTLWEVPDDLATELHKALRVVGDAILKAVQASGLNVVMNNFASAGQVVPHAHWHLIPRHEGDNLIHVVQGQYGSDQEMQNTAQDIRRQLSSG